MFLENLNNKQREAVEKIGGPILVFAGAGSGKTRVLTHKIAYLIKEVGLPPENILAVTFTNKAAQEMKSRVVDLVDVDIAGINIGTFHSISAQILRREIQHLGYENNFTIYDQQDSRAIVKMAIKDLNLDIKQYDPKTYQAKISSAKNSMHSLDYLRNSSETLIDKKFVDIYEKYQEMLKANNSLDFDDLLIFPVKLFNEYPDRLDFYQAKFQYVLVDEYQDTNKPQFEFIHLISLNHRDIFVVGDDDQSIYGWRGADISNILNFQEAFGKSAIIKLEQNYRSTKNILEAAWSVVSKNSNRAEKKLWTDNDRGKKIDVLSSFDERIEAKNILKHILNSEKDFNQIAVLYRTNSQSRPIEDELRRGGVPYQIIGGVKFYDRKEIKDVLAYLKLIVNHSDSVSFTRIVNFPARGIGKGTIEKIEQYSKDNNISFYEVLRNPESLNISFKQKKTLKNFYDLIYLYRNRCEKENASSIVKDLLKEINLKNYYEKQQTTDALDRWYNIEELISSISEFEDNDEDGSLVKYLEEVSLLTDVDRWNESDKSITMMTIHSAKGLEFDNVYISGLEDGLFPIIRLMEIDDFEEERRLFYVALTRGREECVLSYAKSRRKFGSAPISSKISRFINEIPSELINDSFKAPPILNASSNSYVKAKEVNKPQVSSPTIKRNAIVEHKIFGRGEVVNIEGAGENAKVTILFSNNITKKFIFKYANLTLIQ